MGVSDGSTNFFVNIQGFWDVDPGGFDRGSAGGREGNGPEAEEAFVNVERKIRVLYFGQREFNNIDVDHPANAHDPAIGQNVKTRRPLEDG